MKVLFVARKKVSKNQISPFISSQAESLINENIDVDIFEASGKGFGSYIKNAIKLKKQIANNQYDIIHSHYSFQGLLALIAAPGHNHVLSFMGSDLNVLLEKSNSLKKWASKILLHFLLSRLSKFKAVIVKSKNLFDLVSDKHINIHIIPNGIDFEKFYPFDREKAKQKVGFDSKAKIIGFFTASEIDANKNIDMAKESIKQIDKSISVQFKHIYGIDHSELVYYYNAIDVMLFTSKMEGSPNVIKEALACNCPVVSVSVGDVKERLLGVKNSYLCDNNPSQIAKKLSIILNENKRTNGRIMMESLKNVNVANQIIQIYKNSIQ